MNSVKRSRSLKVKFQWEDSEGKFATTAPNVSKLVTPKSYVPIIQPSGLL